MLFYICVLWADQQLDFLQRAARLDYAAAQFELGLWHWLGYAGVAQDRERALHWWTRGM